MVLANEPIPPRRGLKRVGMAPDAPFQQAEGGMVQQQPSGATPQMPMPRAGGALGTGPASRNEGNPALPGGGMKSVGGFRRPGAPAQMSGGGPTLQAGPPGAMQPIAAGMQATAPAAGMVPTTPINPANDLRGQAILPTADARLTAAQGATDAVANTLPGADTYPGAVDARTGQLAAQLQTPQATGGGTYTPQALTGSGAYQPTALGAAAGVQARSVQAGAAVDPTANDPRLTNAQGFLDTATGSVGNLDRVAMAKAAQADFVAGQERPLQQALRRVGQSFAGRGALGSGMANREVAEEVAAAGADADRNQNALIRDLTERNASDAFAKADLGRGLVGDELGRGSQIRGEQRTERNYSTALDAENADRAYSADTFNAGRQDTRDLYNADTSNTASRYNLDRGDTVNRYNADAANAASQYNIGRADDRERYNLDTSRAAILNAAGMARGDVGAQSDAAYRKYGTLADREATAYGRGVDARAETRGERGQQEELARYALEQQIRQRQMENDEQGDEFSRSLARAQLGLASSGQQQAASGDMLGAFSDAFGGYLARRRQKTAPAGSN